MKKNKIFKMLGVIGLSLLTCSCAFSQPKVLVEENRKCKNPFVDTTIEQYQDMHTLAVLSNPSYASYNNAYTNYCVFSNINSGFWCADRYLQDFSFWCTLDSNNLLSFNMKVVGGLTSGQTRTATLLSVCFPLELSINQNTTGNVITQFGSFDSTHKIYRDSLLYDHPQGTGDEDNVLEIIDQYAYNSFDDFKYTKAMNDLYSIKNYDLTLEGVSDTWTRTTYYIVQFNSGFTFTYTEGQSASFSIPLGYFKAFSINYNNNALYTLDDNGQAVSNAYNEGFDNGRQNGISQGEQNALQQYQGLTYQQIYSLGYNSGYDARGTSKLPALFGAIVNIPISVLNGLVPLSYFDISIMRVVITIMALNIILYVISYVMSAKG